MTLEKRLKRECDVKVTISNCEDEPIRVPGAIQPHGILVVIDKNHKIIQISQNVSSLLGRSHDVLLGQNLSELLTESGAASVRHHLAAENLGSLVPLLLEIKTTLGSNFASACVAHKYNQYYILEFEPAELSLNSAISISGALNDSIQRLHSTRSMTGVLELAASEIKSLTGYDRVMVYRFDRDWHGEIIAEAKEPHLDSLKGLHYPASDIPVQARELYKKNLVRIIADVDYNSSALVPTLNPETGQSLDLSDCILRSVSPIHVEYLRNMGVQATLTISLLVRGELWGLIACHHYSPKYQPFATRAACQLFGQVLALSLFGFVETDKYKAEVVNIKAFDEFLAVFRTTDGNLIKAFELWGEGLLETFACAGVALLTDNRVFTFGQTLTATEIRQAAHLIECSQNPIFSTESISSIQEFQSAVGLAGLLAWRISNHNDDWIMCFRPEQAQTVTWAGKPEKATEMADGSIRLHPRGSFALWQEEVKDTSMPWTEQNLESAIFLKAKILELRKESFERNSLDVKRSTTARDEFVATIAHDLKTPIMGAIRVLEFIKNGQLGENVENFRTVIDQLISSHRLLFERVKSILILYQYSEDTALLAVEKVDLAHMLREAIEMNSSLATVANVKIELNLLDAPLAVADSEAVRRVLENLLSNAVKFSPEGSTINVSLTSDQNAAVVKVSDEGVGVPEAELGYLFKKFWRGTSGRKFTSGTGLGLYVCRKIIETHRGKIWCESTVGKGSTFYVELPLDAADDHDLDSALNIARQ